MLIRIIFSVATLAVLPASSISAQPGQLPGPCTLEANGPLASSAVWGLRNFPPWLTTDRPPGVRSGEEGTILLDRTGRVGETRRWAIRRSNLSLGREGEVVAVGVAEGRVSRTLTEEVEPGLWVERITWERFAFGQSRSPGIEVVLEEAPAVKDVSYARRPGELDVPMDVLGASAPGIAGAMLQALALDVATWRGPIEGLRREIGSRVSPGDWICEPPRPTALDELDPESSGLTYHMGESVIAVAGSTVVNGEAAALIWFAIEGNRVEQNVDLGPSRFEVRGTEYFRGFVAISTVDGRSLAGSLFGPLMSRNAMMAGGGEARELPLYAVLQEVSFREVR